MTVNSHFVPYIPNVLDVSASVFHLVDFGASIVPSKAYKYDLQYCKMSPIQWIPTEKCNECLKSIARFGGKLECSKYPSDMVLCTVKEILIIFFFSFFNSCDL